MVTSPQHHEHHPDPSQDRSNLQDLDLPKIQYEKNTEKNKASIFSLICLTMLAGGCATPWTMRSLHHDLETIRAGIEPPSKRPELKNELIAVRCAFHVHSHFSHDSEGKIKDIARAAKACGIQIIFLTDHTNPKIFTDCPEGVIDGVHFIRGEEISKRGSILALGTSSSIDPHGQSPQAVIDEITKQKGIAAIGHLEKTDPFNVHGYDAVGIYNLHTDAKKLSVLSYPKIFLDVLLYGNKYPDEVLLHDIVEPPTEQLHTWDTLLKERRLAGIAEIDAHQNINILGKQVDPYETILKLVHTYVLLPENWKREDLFDAIKKGRTYVGFTAIADPTGFTFELRQREDCVATIGGEIKLQPKLDLYVKSPASGKIVIIKDGEKIFSMKTDELYFKCDQPGVYRAEVWQSLDNRELPWIISSPIYVR